MRPLIDLETLRSLEPDPVKRVVWLLGAATATTRAVGHAASEAADALRAFSTCAPVPEET